LSEASGIAVLGAGSWGTALAVLLARNRLSVRLWGHTPAHVQRLIVDGENRAFLPGVALPPHLAATSELREAIGDAREILIVVPSHAFPEVVEQVAQRAPTPRSLSWATKGFEQGTGRLLHEVAQGCLPQADLAVLSGPTFAAEVARGLPTAITVASTSPAHAARLAGYLHGEAFRVYTASDLIGVEVGGAVKNIMAIAAGIADGLNFGANARAALITRGLAEISRLGTTLGGSAQTFTGLAGLGDLALTCTDDQSRNRRLGLAIAHGLTIEQAKAEIGQEVEGVGTTAEVFRLAHRHRVDMPITEQTHAVLFEGKDPAEAVRALFERRLRAETAQ
jgi:glycerol-3-phosphate dehydrogenase (NAD(P)+)